LFQKGQPIRLFIASANFGAYRVFKSSPFLASLHLAGLPAGLICNRFSPLFYFGGHWRLALTDAGQKTMLTNLY